MADRTLEETQAYAEITGAAFYDAFTSEEQQKIGSELERAMTRNSRAAVKIEAINIAADKIFRHATGRVACARGCAHCCYIAVSISAVEAKAIGERIGVEPKSVTNIGQRDPASFSNATPCPFLENEECSIYENRPLECRANFNFDRDNYWCRLENADKPGAVIPKPMIPLLAMSYQFASMGDKGVPTIADIRDFFPNGKR